MGFMSNGGLNRSDDFEKVLAGYRLTTASILYRMPDHPALLQEFIWQELDQIPKFPVLKRFIRYWEKECDGKLYRVKVAVADGLDASKWRNVGDDFLIQ